MRVTVTIAVCFAIQGRQCRRNTLDQDERDHDRATTIVADDWSRFLPLSLLEPDLQLNEHSFRHILFRHLSGQVQKRRFFL